MSLNYASIAKDVSSLIASVGTSVTCTRLSSSLWTTTGVFENITTTESKSDSASRLTRLNNKQCALTIGDVSVPPIPGDTITGNGQSYKIVEVFCVQPAAVVISYKLTLQ